MTGRNLTSHEKVGGSSLIGFGNALTLIFITLKLTHYIDWSWWLVLLPLYGGLAAVLLFAAVCFLFAVIMGAIEHYISTKRWKARARKSLEEERKLR